MHDKQEEKEEKKGTPFKRIDDDKWRSTIKERAKKSCHAWENSATHTRNWISIKKLLFEHTFLSRVAQDK